MKKHKKGKEEKGPKLPKLIVKRERKIKSKLKNQKETMKKMKII